MTDAQFTTLCGMISRGASLPTACEILGLDLRDVMDTIGDDRLLLCDLYQVMIMRAAQLHLPTSEPIEPR